MNCFSGTQRDEELQLKCSKAKSIVARMDVGPPLQKPKQLIAIPYQEVERRQRAGSSEESEMYKLSLANIAKRQQRDRLVSQEE